GGDHRDERVRRKLVASLYTQPLSLALGAICGIAASLTAAYTTGYTPIMISAWLLTLVGITRTIMAIYVAKSRVKGSTRALELAYEIGAFSFALLAGIT